MSSSKKRTPSPAPTITLDPNPKRELQRSSSEDSIRVIHHAVLFPASPHAGRVTYIRRIFETDADLIKRQQAAIALQPLTYAEELKARRKQLELKAEKRKQEKAAAETGKTGGAGTVPEIAIIPASGKQPAASSQAKTGIRDRSPHSEIGKGSDSKQIRSKPSGNMQRQSHLSVRNAMRKKVTDKPKDKVTAKSITDTDPKTSK